MKQNKKIAVTGGIGSGKSTVSQIISDRGYKVYSCDEIYSRLLNEGLTQKIGKLFPEAINDEGKLDRKALSAEVFTDGEKLRTLTELTNGEVIKSALKQMDETEGVTFCEVPLLFENGFENLFDGVIVVMRSLKERIISVATRDNLSDEEVINRINSQYNYDNADFSKYYVIHNDGNLEQLKAKVQQIIDKICPEAGV